MNLTIVVPTLNRSKKFENLLEHYSNNNYKGTILVMDSSNLNEKKNNILSIKKFSSLKIKYVYLAKKIYRKEYLKYVQRIKTKYTVCSGDDDFFIVNSLKYLITFLDKNNSYHGACGIGLSCFKDKNKYRTYLYKNLQDLNDKNATERIKKQFSSEGYTVAHYSIIRTSSWKKIKNLKFYGSTDISGEYFYTLSLAYIARIKQFKKLIYLVRSLGHQRYILQIPKEKEILNLSKILNEMIKKNNLAEYENNKNLVSKLLYKRLERIKNKNKFFILKKLKKSKNFVYGKKFQNFLDFTRINKYYSLKFSLGSLTKEKINIVAVKN